MMCTAHLVRATTIINEQDMSQEIQVRDEQAEIEEDGDERTVGGFVLGIVLGTTDDAPTVAFDIEETRAFIEACQEILERYD